MYEKEVTGECTYTVHMKLCKAVLAPQQVANSAALQGRILRSPHQPKHTPNIGGPISTCTLSRPGIQIHRMMRPKCPETLRIVESKRMSPVVHAIF
jgi:hypothetical protein